jgi:tRNA (cytidine32/uridine32-2'-O)-methyltransferase
MPLLHVAIPANPEYSSLNLAMAVQTLCYEVRMRWLKDQVPEEDERVDYPSARSWKAFISIWSRRCSKRLHCR